MFPNVRQAPLTLSEFRSFTVGATAETVRDTPGVIHGVNVINLHSAAVFVKLYNKDGATQADTPAHTWYLPAGGAVLLFGTDPVLRFNTAISVRCVTGSADNDTTAPGTKPLIELHHKTTP